MGKIRMLSDSMIGKIAAGEVVERPVSALKELVENSLDAGATAVTVEIREGGLSYLRVTDNGCGIDESDLRMAFERHATSKISDERDLYSIHTLGFRGEALASIAAVSHIVMTTRTQQNETGLRVTNEGGRIQKIEETACTTGTTILVTDLFFNTPVRKGFMKKASAEAASIHELMTRFILSRPDISFRYLCDGKTALHSPGDGHLETAALSVYGTKAMKAMRRVEGHAGGILLKGYVGIGENARGNRGQEYFFINGRMMHSPILSNAVETACRERVMIGKFPVCALHMKIAYEAVDVNVHPNKLEVRFRDENAVGEAVMSLVLEALKDQDAFEKPVEMLLNPEKKQKTASVQEANAFQPEDLRKALQNRHAVVSVTDKLPEISDDPDIMAPVSRTILRENIMRPFVRPETGSMTEKKAPAERKTEGNAEDSAGCPVRQPVRQIPGAPDGPAGAMGNGAAGLNPPEMGERPDAGRETAVEQVNTILPGIRKDMKVFGALFNTFILVEYEDQLLMVDQHAVHERLLFDRLMTEQNGQNAGQELLIPMILSASAREQALIEENRELYESIGLVIERFGEHDIAVRTIPMILGEAETAGFVRELLAESEKSRTLSMEKKRADILQTACKHAVKGGEALTEDQLRGILDEMLEKKVTPTCPHGRPLVVSVSHREIDRKFKRIQN